MAVPSEDYSRQPPAWAHFMSVKGDRPKTNSKSYKKKTMKTKTQNKSASPKNQNRSDLQSRSEQLGSEKQIENKPKLLSVDFDLRRANRCLPTEKVLQMLQEEAPRFWELAEVVGKWIWIQFQEKQPREVTMILSQIGFHWNNTRQAWQHPCGHFTQQPASYDPRTRYGSSFPADMKVA